MNYIPKHVFITGCSRGLGLELVKQFVLMPKTPEVVFATCRKPSEAEELQKVAAENKIVKILQLDVTDYDSYPAVVDEITKVIGNDAGINLLINNAGINSKRGTQPVQAKTMLDIYNTNVVGPFLLTKTLIPLLQKAAIKNASVGKSLLNWAKAAVINVSSELGSIAMTKSGGSEPYRASKAALNMITKIQSVELHRDSILVVAIHPGWVKTDMGGPQAPLDTETSIKSMLETFSKLSNEHQGHLLRYNGEIVPF